VADNQSRRLSFVLICENIYFWKYHKYNMTTKTHKPCIKEMRDITIGAVNWVIGELTIYVLETEYRWDISANITGSLSAATMLTVLVGSSSVECLSHWPSKPVSRSSFTEYWKLRCASYRTNNNVTFNHLRGTDPRAIEFPWRF